jgi:hypothetical protein
VGLFGVIGSLMFVGLQLRQTQAIALSETYQNRTATSIDASVGIMTSPAALSGVSKIYRNEFDKLTMPEAVAVEQVIGNSLTLIENNHLQFQQGFLSEEHWQRNMNELNCILTVPLFRDIAAAWDFRDSFEKVIADAIKEIPPDAENCWSYPAWDFPME